MYEKLVCVCVCVCVCLCVCVCVCFCTVQCSHHFDERLI